MKKAFVVALTVLFVLGFAVPAFGSVYPPKQGSMHHHADYHLDGDIDLEKQVGHLCNTGAQMNQEIHGEGEMFKTMSTGMIQGRLTVEDDNDWVTAVDAVRNLTVTSSIKLCAPAKTEFKTTDWIYDSDIGNWVRHAGTSGIASPRHLYGLDAIPTRFPTSTPPYFFSGNQVPTFGPAVGVTLTPQWSTGGWAVDRGGGLVGFDANGDPVYTYSTYGSERHLGQRFDAAGAEAILNYTDVSRSALTDQVWSVSVEADPGFSGRVYQNFEAAYGPYEDWARNMTRDWRHDGPVPAPFGDDGIDVHKDAWGWRVDEDNYATIETGDDYVGNYFNIEQFARTSQGTVRRFIDISSPWSGAYIHEDMEVVGFAEIEEAFHMENIPAGASATPDWWDIF